MKKCIVFDLDGTILYTLKDLLNATNYSLNKYGYESISLEEVEKFIGNGIRLLIERALKGKKANIDLLYKDFIEYYKNNYANETYPYPNIINILNKLKSKGIINCVLTNKAEVIARPLINDKFGDLFDLVLGEKAGRNKKPNIDGIVEIMNQYNLNKEDILYIGDSDVDIKLALNANIDALIVSYGYRSYDMLKKESSFYICKTPFELEEKISIYLQ